MENKYLKTKVKKDCNGCTACSLVCPKNCIKMEEDTEGFIYPVVDDTKCIHCNKCLNTCSNYEKADRQYKAFAIITKDSKILSNSTSGGAFYSIIESFFKKENAVCYGVTLDKNLDVKHIRIDNLKDIKKIMGSKYVRSDITGIYEEVKKDLLNNMNVLFSGTSCQIEGLYTYLGKEYKNLVTCNIICQSNPSPKVFKKYIYSIEKTYDCKVKDIKFRAKENGWSNLMPIIEFKNGDKLEENAFITAFIRGLISRPSCSDCKFLKPYNYADITIGDFWGVKKLTDIQNVDQGISLVLANTDVGLDILSNLQNVRKYELDKSIDVFSYNHKLAINEHRNRKKFFKKIDLIEDEKFILYLKNNSKERLLRRILNKIK